MGKKSETEISLVGEGSPKWFVIPDWCYLGHFISQSFKLTGQHPNRSIPWTNLYNSKSKADILNSTDTYWISTSPVQGIKSSKVWSSRGYSVRKDEREWTNAFWASAICQAQCYYRCVDLHNKTAITNMPILQIRKMNRKVVKLSTLETGQVEI